MDEKNIIKIDATNVQVGSIIRLIRNNHLYKIMSLSNSHAGIQSYQCSFNKHIYPLDFGTEIELKRW